MTVSIKVKQFSRFYHFLAHGLGMSNNKSNSFRSSEMICHVNR